MAYEVQAVSPTVTPTDASIASSPVMREERVIEPYRQRNVALKAQVAPSEEEEEKIGQNDTSDPSALESGGEAPLPKEPEESVTLSPQMAALARKEAAFRRQQQELKAQMAEFAKERAEIEELRQIKARIAARDFSDIEKMIPYDAYTSYLIEKGTTATPEQQSLKKVETELEEMKRSQKEQQERSEQAAIAERRDAVKALVGSNEAFATIKELQQEESVVQHIRDTWSEDGIELTVEQAAKEVEEILVERAKQWASVTKIKQALPPVEEKKHLPPLKPGTKTLTNEMTIQGEPKVTRKSFQGMTDAERYAEARRRAEEKLKLGIR